MLNLDAKKLQVRLSVVVSEFSTTRIISVIYSFKYESVVGYLVKTTERLERRISQHAPKIIKRGRLSHNLHKSLVFWFAIAEVLITKLSSMCYGVPGNDVLSVDCTPNAMYLCFHLVGKCIYFIIIDRGLLIG